MDNENNGGWVRLEEYPNYELNQYGQIRSIKTGTILQNQQNGIHGSVYRTLENKDGVNKSIRIDTLVVRTFMHNDGTHSDADIIHLDGNEGNCSLENLAWDDGEYASKQYYEKTGIQKPKEYFVFYPLMEFPDSQYEINKMGQIQNKYTRKVLTGGLASGGYRSHILSIDKKAVFRSAHLLVAKQFIPNPENKPFVNHIDEDKANPCIDNLKWAIGAENVHHGTALDRGNLGRYKAINEYNIQGRYIRTWKSIKHLSDFLDHLNPSIPSKSHKSLLRYYLSNNKDRNVKKLEFANRVFMYYEGNCDDLLFTIRKSKRKWVTNFNYSFDDKIIPDDYLVEKLEDKVDSLVVLQEMIKSRMNLSVRQKQALRYAITCMKIVKENETVIDKIIEVIHDYQSLKS